MRNLQIAEQTKHALDRAKQVYVNILVTSQREHVWNEHVFRLEESARAEIRTLEEQAARYRKCSACLASDALRG